ncbi:unnamed protein product [Euphydryas editha]|uniref:Uncharacterized protein n=1 Tax=Euphydryas editha TaxID=104508 RepID=A0AAU9UWU6_EUPED|nr:unnamed protein product [Euphydryas editha]
MAERWRCVLDAAVSAPYGGRVEVASVLEATRDYRGEIPAHSVVSELQLKRTRMLLNEGVRLGIIRPDYLIAGASDLTNTASPGSILLEAFRSWKNYDHQHRFRSLNCTQMQERYGNVTLVDQE